MATADTAGMGFATVTELPLRLHRVEPDPFIESIPGDRTDHAQDWSGASDLTPAAAAELAVAPGELRVRSRHAELAA
jgi:hypothetical protein